MRIYKLLSLVSLLMISLAIQAYNVGDIIKINGFSYRILTNSTTQGGTVTPGTVEVAGTTLTGAITVPETVTDNLGTVYKVTRVGLRAFSGVTGVTSITIQEGVTSINNSGFGECTDLETVNLPASVTTMGVNIFVGSPKFKNVYINSANTKYADIDGVLCSADKKTLMVYPHGRTETTYTVPSSIETINGAAFLSTILQSIDLGSTKTLNGVVFNTCSELTSLTFPAEMTTIPITTGFYTKCYKLAEFNVKPGNLNYSSQDGILFNADKTELISCPQAKVLDSNYSIPATVKKIAANAFYMSKLSEITIPSSVETIGRLAFDNCAIKKLTIEEGVKNIEYRAFNNCYNLTTATIPSSATNIGENIFLGCSKLTDIAVASGNPNYESKDGVMFTKGLVELYSFPAAQKPTVDYTIPTETRYIGSYAFFNAQKTGTQIIPNTVLRLKTGCFEGSRFKNITFEATSTVEALEASSFRVMPNLESIEIPASVKEIGQAICQKCPKLKSVTFAPNSQLTSMKGVTPNGAFEGCTSLTTITIGENSPIPIGQDAFRDCTALTTLTAGSGGLKTIEGTAFINCKNLRTLDIANSALTTIGTRAFENCTGLTNIAMPATLKTIGLSAFTNCTNLASVTFPDDSQLEKIGRNAFQDSGLTTIKLPTSLKSVDTEAFYRCTKLETVEIPAGTTHVASQAFSLCSKLTAINVDPNNQKYSSLDGMLLSKDRTRLLTFPAGKANSRYTRLPAFINEIDSAFYGCEELTNITIPSTVTSIHNFAFANTKNLKSISFLGNIPTLANETFLNTDVTKITLFVRKGWYEAPNNQAIITEMKAKGFKEIHPSFIATDPQLDRGVEYFPTSTTTAGVIAFSPQRTSVIIPSSVQEIYQGVTNNYEVATVLDFAFQDNQTTETVVFLGKLEEIGMRAFSQQPGNADNKIKNIYFVNDAAPTMASVEFDAPEYYPFASGQNIYVKPSKVEAYKTAFKDIKSTVNITDNITSEIPTQTSKNRATACYPFDVTYTGDIMPYLPLQYKKTASDIYYVRSLSVDDGYVPANIGVLLRSKLAENATSYCQMTEAQNHAPVNNTEYSESSYMMKGVVEDKTVMGDNATLYALSKTYGEFRKIKTTGTKIPYFRAYLQLPSAPSPGKEVKFVFDDESIDETVTGIDAIGDNSNDKEVYYNLNGTRVENPTKAVYISNGKKVILK